MFKLDCCVRCSEEIQNNKSKYNKLDGVVCKLCYEKEYRKINRAKLNNWHKAYSDSHRDIINAQARERYNTPNSKRKLNDKEWRKNNPEYIRQKAKDIDTRIKDCSSIVEPATVILEIVPNFDNKTSEFIVHKDRFGRTGARIVCGFDHGRYVTLTDEEAVS